MPGITGISLAFQVAAKHEQGSALDNETVCCSRYTAKKEMSLLSACYFMQFIAFVIGRNVSNLPLRLYIVFGLGVGGSNKDSIFCLIQIPIFLHANVA